MQSKMPDPQGPKRGHRKQHFSQDIQKLNMTASYLGKQPNSFLERKDPLMKKTFTKQFIENKMEV